MFCTNCGASVSDTSRFCGACGSPLNAEQPSPNTVQNEYIAPVPAVNDLSSPAQSVPVTSPEPVPPVDNADGVSPAPVAESSVIPENGQSFSGEVGEPVQAETNLPFGTVPPEPDPQLGFQPAMPAPNVQEGIPAPAAFQPQEQEYGVGAAAVVKPERKPVKKLNLAVTILISILFGIIAYGLLISAFSLGSVRQGLADHALSEGISDIDLGKLVIGDLLSDPAMKNTVKANNIVLPKKKAEKATVAQVVALSVSGGDLELTEEQVEKIINKLKISDELGTVVKAYEDYLINGKPGDEFEDGYGEEIKRIVKDGESDVIKITDMRLADDYEDQLDKVLDENEDLLEGILPENSLKSYSGAIGAVFSPVLLICALVLAVALIALVGLISKRITACLMTGGVVFILTGGALTASSVVIQQVASLPGWSYECVAKIVSVIYNAFGYNLLYSGIICAGLGVVLVAVFIILKVIGNSKRKKAAVQ